MSADQAGEAKGPDPLGGDAGGISLDTGAPPKSAQKVELDLDDAPFLDEEEESPPEPPKPQEALALEPEPKPEKPARKFQLPSKKILIIGAGALVLLIVLGVAAKMFLFKPKSEPAAEPKDAHSAPKEQAPAENATEAKPEVPEIQVKLEPFWVEQKDDKDEVRFLIVRMLLGTQDKAVVGEMKTKLLPMRNAIYYYLKNKDVQFLSDERNAEKMKAELLLVINQYIAAGKFDSIMFEEYVVK